MSETKFFICKHCGNLIGMIFNSGAPITCCGDHMTLLEANTVDASHEKHIPVVHIDDNKVVVNIGSVDHPMTEAHYIGWIYLQTESGGQRKNLIPGDAPNVEFCLDNEKSIAVFAYCNLHGLWKKEI
ncbi:MAG: desulfoferrodoxin [Clostridiales bacterium GWF2_36_10]|nr:MAG: desulfoferrodoxin [Clostridiales bacterium GWF2_36_10]HAN20622.1 desulfoferrodoxin [Clostridiales bacterium]